MKGDIMAKFEKNVYCILGCFQYKLHSSDIEFRKYLILQNMCKKLKIAIHAKMTHPIFPY